MDGIIEFLRDNAQWLFGGGGLAAVVLGLIKARGGKGAPPPAPAAVSISGGRVEGDVTGRDRITRTGFGGLEVALLMAVIVAGLGAAFYLMEPGTTVSASCGSGAVVGDGNTVTVTGGIADAWGRGGPRRAAARRWGAGAGPDRRG